MGAALKAEQLKAPENLSELHTVELAKILYEESRGSSRAMAAYQEILSRQALEDLKRTMGASKWAENKLKGPEATRTNAELMRDDWRRTVTRLLLIGHMTRKQLVSTLAEYSKGRYRGKHGQHIEASTIERWLTVITELQIRRDVDQLRAQGVTATTYKE